jgi:hypothetical protein
MDSTINQHDDIQDVFYATDEVGEVKNRYPWEKGALRPWQKGFLWPWQKEFCLPCWVGITILMIFVLSLFIPFIWYVINVGLN